MTVREDLSNTIREWAATRTDKAVLDPTVGYYPFDVIADAYKQGVEHGEEKLKEEVRKKYFKNSELMTNSINELFVKLNGFKNAFKFAFIQLDLKQASVLVSIDEDIYISDKFLDKAYSVTSDLKTAYFDKGLDLQIGFLNQSGLHDSLYNSLQCDGYDIGIDLTTGSRIY